MISTLQTSQESNQVKKKSENENELSFDFLTWLYKKKCKMKKINIRINGNCKFSKNRDQWNVIKGGEN